MNKYRAACFTPCMSEKRPAVFCAQLWQIQIHRCITGKQHRENNNNKITLKRTRSLSNAQCCLYLSPFLKYLTCNFDNLELGLFKVIQCQRSYCQSIANGWLPIRLLLTPTSYLSPFLKYLTCNFVDLELGQFKVIQGHRSWRQSTALSRFCIRLPWTPLWYLSPFLRYLTLMLLFDRMQA